MFMSLSPTAGFRDKCHVNEVTPRGLAMFSSTYSSKLIFERRDTSKLAQSRPPLYAQLVPASYARG
jgi:hypothetical protein